MTDYKNYKAEDLLLDERFLNYCKDTNAADKAFWENLLAESPDLQTEAEQAKKIFHLLNVSVPVDEKKLAIQRLKSGIAAGLYSKEEATPVIPIMPRKKLGWIRIAAAAAIVGIVALTISFFTRSNTIESNSLADFSKVSYKELAHASNSERRTIELPDGSVAELNYGSVLKIADNFNKDQRWVYLEGEAFFSVTKNQAKPFVVITTKTATTALGTSFKVRSYSDEKNSTTMLATGKVKVQSLTKGSNQKQDLLLLPGEAAGWDEDAPLAKSSFDLAELENWRSETILFEKAGLDDIIRTLRFYYGVQVQLENKPGKSIAFTGKFFGKSLKDVLEAIAFTNKFSYSQNGNTISIRFQ